MKKLTAGELRKWASDMEQNYGHIDRIAHLLEAHASNMRARADYIDAIDGTDSGIAAVAEVTQSLPIIGKIKIQGGKIVAIDRPYNCEGEQHGIHVAFEWRNDPSAEERAGSMCRLYIGSESQGPLAMYDADDNQWHALISRGNFGKRYACGGNFSSKKVSEQPEIVNTLEGVMERQARIAKAEMKLKAAKLRVRAAHQMDNALAYERQAMNPIYDGQSMICMGKADIIRAHSGQTLAEAELLEAQAS